MAIYRPFKRTCRQFLNGRYNLDPRCEYILHPKYAISPEHYVRAFLLLQKDLLELFDYIEPADMNLNCYSYRTHELLLRACVEVEANWKAILFENGYPKTKDLNINDYKKINQSHRLSSYTVKIPYWSGDKFLRQPFSKWEDNGILDWYQAYNLTKHDRHNQFSSANFDNVLDAICGAVVILSAQFFNQDFSPKPGTILEGWPNDGYQTAIGDYFLVKFPDDWPTEERYEFNWQKLRNANDPFDKFAYS